MVIIPQQLQSEKIKFLLVAKKEKYPIEKRWQENNNYLFDSSKLQQHINEGGNYGVLCGNNLIVIDADTDKLRTLVEDYLPSTFTVQTSKGYHYYYFTEGFNQKKVLKDGNEHLGEIQNTGSFVVGPNSIHPSGDTYKSINTEKINNLSLEKINKVLKQYFSAEKINKEVLLKGTKQGLRNSSLFRIACSFREKKLTQEETFAAIKNINTKNNPPLPEHEIKIIVESAYSYSKEKEIQKRKDLNEFQKELYILIIEKKMDEVTEKIVNYLKKTHYIYTTRDDEKSEMWIYHEGIYIPEGRTRLTEEVRQLLGKIFKKHTVNNILLKIEADTGIDKDEFFESATKNIDEIPLKNGLFNIRKNELNEFSPKKIFFNKLPITYDPKAVCPNIDQHFKDVLKSEDDAKVMYELFGYLLWKDYFIEKAIMMVGNGRNGKTKTIELMKRFLGADNCISIPLEGMQGDNFMIGGLFGKMANLAGDLNNTSLKDTGKFKQITGRDIITANRKFKTPISFINYSKQVFACNELPRVYDSSLGFWSRWVLFEFPYTFLNNFEYKTSELTTKRKMNPDQIKKITTDGELSGLFNVAVKELKCLLENKNFSYSTGTDTVKQFWVRKSNSFAAFCMDHLEESYDSYITKKDLRKAFKKYTKEHKLPGISDRAIKITLEEEFGVTDSRKYLNDEQLNVWEGIKFKNDHLSKYFKKMEKKGQNGGVFTKHLGN